LQLWFAIGLMYSAVEQRHRRVAARDAPRFEMSVRLTCQVDRRARVAKCFSAVVVKGIWISSMSQAGNKLHKLHKITFLDQCHSACPGFIGVAADLPLSLNCDPLGFAAK
jgi:hypothetical protein